MTRLGTVQVALLAPGERLKNLLKSKRVPKNTLVGNCLQLGSSEKYPESATLPHANIPKEGGHTGKTGSLQHKPPQHQTLPIVVTSGGTRPGESSVPHGAGSKSDVSHRTPADHEADRRKYLSLIKDANYIRAADLDLLESIGTGEFGVIRRGYVFDRTEAMIHCLKRKKLSYDLCQVLQENPTCLAPHKQSSQTVAESLMERLDASVKAGFHPHIVSLLGLCHEAGTTFLFFFTPSFLRSSVFLLFLDVLYACLQLETGPNLRNMLRESRSLDQFMQYTNARGRLSLMSPQRLLNIILGIARGMGHLEESQVRLPGIGSHTVRVTFPPVIHAPMILIDHDHEVD